MKNFTIVTDPGIDDLIALLLLFELSPKSENVLVSTFGNAPERFTSQNAKEFIVFMANNWRFIHGSKEPLKPLKHSWPTYFHGPDGVWEIHPEVDIEKVYLLEDYPEDLHVISLGPMTDVYKMQKKIKIKQITIMGGAFNVGGNETQYAETNIAFDPDAAAKFFHHCNGNDIKIVPLDVTTKVFWTKEQILDASEKLPYQKWAKRLLLTWFQQYGDKKQMNFELHDPLAVYLTFYPQLAKWTSSGVEVVTKGSRRGQTVLSRFNPKCKIAVDIIDSQGLALRLYKKVFM
ncbi:nucleoside hydrolase [Candidatus Microgenomates bacterium]|nr:nucleoside hydrolase [Candidatus Microgenomates bacterium]